MTRNVMPSFVDINHHMYRRT